MSGNRIRAAAGFPAALLVPRNQIGEPQDARSPRPGCAEGRVPGAYRICSAFQAVGAGEIWLLLRARNRLDISSGWPERPSALSLSSERAQPSLSLPRPRTGQGPVPWPRREREASEGTCLRRGPRAPHSAGSAWVESMGNPAGLRCWAHWPCSSLRSA